jgi:hypothetical protein
MRKGWRKQLRSQLAVETGLLDKRNPSSMTQEEKIALTRHLQRIGRGDSAQFLLIQAPNAFHIIDA